MVKRNPNRITYKKSVYGRVGTLSGQTLYRSMNTLYVFTGRGKERKPLSVARFI